MDILAASVETRDRYIIIIARAYRPLPSGSLRHEAVDELPE